MDTRLIWEIKGDLFCIFFFYFNKYLFECIYSIIIGAPRARSLRGDVYNCEFSTKNCTSLNLDSGPETLNHTHKRLKINETFLKSFQGLGTSMTSNGNNLMIVCAPNLKTLTKEGNYFNGMCYEFLQDEWGQIGDKKETFFRKIFGKYNCIKIK